MCCLLLDGLLAALSDSSIMKWCPPQAFLPMRGFHECDILRSEYGQSQWVQHFRHNTDHEIRFTAQTTPRKSFPSLTLRKIFSLTPRKSFSLHSKEEFPFSHSKEDFFPHSKEESLHSKEEFSVSHFKEEFPFSHSKKDFFPHSKEELFSWLQGRVSLLSLQGRVSLLPLQGRVSVPSLTPRKSFSSLTPRKSFSPTPRKSFSPTQRKSFSSLTPRKSFPSFTPRKSFSPTPRKSFSPTPRKSFSSLTPRKIFLTLQGRVSLLSIQGRVFLPLQGRVSLLSLQGRVSLHSLQGRVFLPLQGRVFSHSKEEFPFSYSKVSIVHPARSVRELLLKVLYLITKWLLLTICCDSSIDGFRIRFPSSWEFSAHSRTSWSLPMFAVTHWWGILNWFRMTSTNHARSLWTEAWRAYSADKQTRANVEVCIIVKCSPNSVLVSFLSRFTCVWDLAKTYTARATKWGCDPGWCELFRIGLECQREDH